MPPKDEETIQYWMGSVDATLQNIQDTNEKSVAWQTGVTEKLESIAGRLNIVELSIVEANYRKSHNNPFNPDNVIQWSWIRSEIMLPIFRYGATLIVAYLFGKLIGIVP